MVSVFLYVPNLIGYVRIALNFVALHYALSDHRASLLCYAASALLDAADGYAARALGQSSLFGTVLDMVTDRTATASLCVVLAHLYPSYLPHFCALVTLDIFSHWAHVYASALSMADTHKSSTNWIVRLYYHKPVLFCVCAGNELFYMCARRRRRARALCRAPRAPSGSALSRARRRSSGAGRFLYLNAFVPGPVVGTIRLPILLARPFVCTASVAAALAVAPIFAFKQLTNCIQMRIAFADINAFELERARRKRAA